LADLTEYIKDPIEMTEYKLLLQRVGLIGIVQLLASSSVFILLPILTKRLPIEDYGIWAQITASITLFPGLVMLGLPYTMVRFLPSLKKDEDIQEIFYSLFFLVVLTSGISSLLIYVFSSTIASILFNNKIIIVKILSLVLLIECLNSFLQNYLRARQRIKRYSFSILIKTVFEISIVSFFVLQGEEIQGAITGLLIADILALLYIFYLTVPEIGIRKPDFRNIKEYLKFGIPTIVGNLSYWIVNSLDRYIIGILLGTALVGYYSPGYTLGSSIGMLYYPLAFLLTATLAKTYDENNLEEVKKILSYSFKYLMAFAIPLLSKPILTVLSTQEIASQGYLITPFVALSALLFGVYGIMSEVLVLEKRTLISGRIWIIAAMLNIVLNFVLIPYFGIIGSAIATLIAFAAGLIITLFYSLKSLRFDLNLKFILKSIVSSILMSNIIFLLQPEGLFSILLTIGICASIYFILMCLLKGISINDLNSLHNLLTN